MNDIARDVTDAEFEARVLERSKEIPVVIDLWAPWCGPCRQLTPILEKVASARSDFELVKLNVDENPQVAALLGARSIPLVVGFRDGMPVSQFLGAQPESVVNEFIDSIQPTEADLKVKAASAAWADGDTVAAESLLKEALELDRQHVPAHVLLAQLLKELDRHEEALKTLRAVPSTGHDAVAHLVSEIRTDMAGDVDVEPLRARLADNPDDIDAAIELGKALGAGGDYGEALPLLLGAVRKNPKHGDGAARQAMLDLFELLGHDAPLTKEYRKKLSQALF